MKSRILKFLSNENKTSAQFAEEIGVQPSGVSHILSGRNNPSLDFVMKMLNRYPNLSTEWLLFGREPMFKRTHNPTLFDDLEPERPDLGHLSGPETDSPIISNDILADVVNPSADTVQTESGKSGKKVERILFFYSDRSFREYNPD